MTDGQAAAVAEVGRERRFAVDGPSWPDHLPRTWPQSADVIDTGPPGAAEPMPRQRRWRCGSGDGCTRLIDRRGLCDEHAAALRAIAEGWEAPRRGPKSISNPKPKTVRPEAVEIDPRDVLDADRASATDRAAHAARFVHRVGRPIRRADFARVAGVAPDSGTMRAVLTAAEGRRWIVRDPSGAVAPGDVLQ